jgi:hypothetical protein
VRSDTCTIFLEVACSVTASSEGALALCTRRRAHPETEQLSSCSVQLICITLYLGDLSPWRPYLEMYISRFSDTMYDELLEKVC